MKKLKKSVIMVLINILKIFKKKKTIDKVNNQCYNKYIIKKESGD